MKDKTSRLSRTSKQKTKKQIAFFGLAIIILIFAAINFGPVLLNGASSLTSGFRKQTTDTAATNANNLEAPFINSIPSATDSAVIQISGSSSYSDAQVELYLNGSSYDTVPLADDQRFSFDAVKLTEGGNTIKARIKKGTSIGVFTKDYNVSYSVGTPKLDVSAPADNQEFKRGDQTITVQGQTDPDNTVTVNDSQAIVDGSGNFSYYLNLSEGDNSIKITATNTAGKTTDKTIKVSYKP